MVPIKAFVVAALPGLMVFAAQAGDPPREVDDAAAIGLVADAAEFQRREARSRLGRTPLPEHDLNLRGG
ncbi:MAG: hypothetical protein F9K44_11955, partial [Hyphomicrobiaceae bacterium]